MAIDRAQIGRKSPPYHVDVEKGQLAFFAKVTGADDPIYFDEVAAKDRGHRAILAPPTFAFSLFLRSPLKLEDLGVDVRRILHGEQHFTHYAPVYAGDRMRLVDEVTDIYDRKGGALEFVVRRTQAVNQDEVLCVEATCTVVVRNG